MREGERGGGGLYWQKLRKKTFIIPHQHFLLNFHRKIDKNKKIFKIFSKNC